MSDKKLPEIKGYDKVYQQNDGAPVYYSWLKSFDYEFCDLVPGLYAQGKTDVEVAVALGVSKNTFYRWINTYPEFADAVQYGKGLSEIEMTKWGKEAAKGDRKIDGKVWHVIMRNSHGWSKKEDTDPLTRKDLNAIDEKISALIKKNEQPC